MKRLVILLTCLAAWGARGSAAEHAATLALHPENPHYLVFRGKPAVLITSGEHYGAVLNADFRYKPYLDALAADGLNLTRTFSGSYREIPESFGIENNTLAPRRPDAFVCPWARSDRPGAGDGGAKFDLGRWNPAYFARLKDFLREASRRGIVVELSLFCTVYDDKLWNVNPMNAANNVGGIGKIGRLEIYTEKDAALTAVQEALARKIVAELNEFDNLYYEICNEPYFGGVSRSWTARMARVLFDAESSRPRRHLIAENIANGSAEIRDPTPHVSIFNFHYAGPPDAVRVNFGLKMPIADDETGFKGTADFWYRREGWEFLLAGGAIYSNLDYSFTAASPGGDAKVVKSPGGGGPTLRRQLAILKRFVESFDFVRMRPHRVEVKASGATVRALAPALALAPIDAGRAYAVYLHGGNKAELSIEAPAGIYRAEWLDTKSGHIVRQETRQHAGGPMKLTSPDYRDDIALAIRAAR